MTIVYQQNGKGLDKTGSKYIKKFEQDPETQTRFTAQNF